MLIDGTKQKLVFNLNKDSEIVNVHISVLSNKQNKQSFIICRDIINRMIKRYMSCIHLFKYNINKKYYNEIKNKMCFCCPVQCIENMNSVKRVRIKKKNINKYRSSIVCATSFLTPTHSHPRKILSQWVQQEPYLQVSRLPCNCIYSYDMMVVN